MLRLRPAVFFATFCAPVLLLAFVLAGCDGNDYREPAPRPVPGADVRNFEVDFDLRDADFSDDLPVAAAAFDASQISRAVVENGLVMAYVRDVNAFGDEVWRALPYTFGVEFDENPDVDEEPAVDYTATLGFNYEESFFEVYYELSAYDDFVWDTLEEDGVRRIRVVAFTESAVRRAQSLDVKNFDAVQERFDLAP